MRGFLSRWGRERWDGAFQNCLTSATVAGPNYLIAFLLLHGGLYRPGEWRHGALTWPEVPTWYQVRKTLSSIKRFTFKCDQKEWRLSPKTVSKLWIVLGQIQIMWLRDAHRYSILYWSVMLTANIQPILIRERKPKSDTRLNNSIAEQPNLLDTVCGCTETRSGHEWGPASEDVSRISYL